MMKTEFLTEIWIMQMNPSLLSMRMEIPITGMEILQNRQRKRKILTVLQKILPVRGISDPFDLYSWDEGTGQYIPFQQAETDVSPVGKGNGWYYYDEESNEFLPW